MPSGTEVFFFIRTAAGAAAAGEHSHKQQRAEDGRKRAFHAGVYFSLFLKEDKYHFDHKTNKIEKMFHWVINSQSDHDPALRHSPIKVIVSPTFTVLRLSSWSFSNSA